MVKAYSVFTFTNEKPFSFPAELVQENEGGFMVFALEGDTEKLFRVRSESVLAYIEEPMEPELTEVVVTEDSDVEEVR